MKGRRAGPRNRLGGDHPSDDGSLPPEQMARSGPCSALFDVRSKSERQPGDRAPCGRRSHQRPAQNYRSSVLRAATGAFPIRPSHDATQGIQPQRITLTRDRDELAAPLP